MDNMLYSIGKAADICGVSQRMLRYYEEIGLIKPDRVDEQSHYRYYGIKTMQRIQIIRYLVDSGFSMEEIGRIFKTDDIDVFRHMMEEKIAETDEKIRYYRQRREGLKSWHSLMVEGKWILGHREESITTKYVPKRRYFIYESEHEKGEADIGFFETQYFTMSKENGNTMVDVGGAFYVLYDNYDERINGEYRRTTLLQTVNSNIKSYDHVTDFGGFMSLCAYHIGPLDKVEQTYNRILDWADKHNHHLRGDCLEKFVIDMYSTGCEDNYVTEIMFPLLDDAEGFERIDEYERV